MKFVLCDDDVECRLEPMRAALLEEWPDAEVILCQDVPSAIETLTSTEDIVVASLDHDYGDWPFEKGIRVRPTRTGHDIVETLAKREKQDYVILTHTSSSDQGNLMTYNLISSNWISRYVTRNGETPKQWLRDRWMADVRWAVETRAANFG